MQEPGIFNPKIFDPKFKIELNDQFCNSKPFRHFIIEDFLNPELANSLFHHFPNVDIMKTHYKGVNEKKSEHSDFKVLDPCFSQLHAALSSEEFISCLHDITKIDSLQVIDDRLGYGLHQGADQSFLDIHLDYNIHPLKKLYRKLNLIFFLNPEWENDWGGHLELWDANVKNCIQSIAPTFNRCALFECSDISYHGYRKINVPEGVTRKSFYQYYFIPVPHHTFYHDTIFKPRPEEPNSKKIITYTKDFVKNTMKRAMLNVGLKKFLK